MFWNFEKTIEEKLEIQHTDLTINGHGGDSAFMKPPSLFSISDAYVSIGLSQALETAREYCFIMRESFLGVLFENVKEILAHYSGIKYKKKLQDDIPAWCNNKSLLNSSDSICHPIYRCLTFLPGKNHHIDSIMNGFSGIQSPTSKNTNEIFYPFMHLPIMEYALKIPTFSLFRNGYDRYPQREGIYKSFKSSTAWRKNKGETTGHLLYSISQNIEYILEICCNSGYLAKNGFIDALKLETEIIKLSYGEAINLWPIIRIYCLEVFLARWQKLNSSSLLK